MILTIVTRGFQPYPATLSHLDELLMEMLFIYKQAQFANFSDNLVFFCVLLPSSVAKLDYVAVETHVCFLYCMEKLH